MVFVVVDDLRRHGLAPVGGLGGAQIDEVLRYLISKPVYANAHVPQTARNRGETTTARDLVPTSECLCVHTHDALLAPHIFEFALSLTDVAADYLGVELPYLYSTNAFWTRPGIEPPRRDIQGFHADADDTRFLVLFTYLTDVLSADDGPHQLLGPDGEVREVLGPAGTMFLADTSYEHRGLKPTLRERGIHWFRWGISATPAAYVWDGLEPVSHTRLGPRYPRRTRLRQSIRPLITPPPTPS